MWFLAQGSCEPQVINAENNVSSFCSWTTSTTSLPGMRRASTTSQGGGKKGREHVAVALQCSHAYGSLFEMLEAVASGANQALDVFHVFTNLPLPCLPLAGHSVASPNLGDLRGILEGTTGSSYLAMSKLSLQKAFCWPYSSQSCWINLVHLGRVLWFSMRNKQNGAWIGQVIL